MTTPNTTTPSPTPAADLITVRRVAATLCVSTKRVYQFLADGRIEAVRLGPRTTRVSRASVERFVAERLLATRRELGLDIKPAGTPHRPGAPAPARR